MISIKGNLTGSLGGEKVKVAREVFKGRLKTRDHEDMVLT
jgi:hypothetical protein